MRILNVTQTFAPFFEFGGPPVKVRALAEGLAAKGHQVTVLTADWGLQKKLLTSPDEPIATPGPFGNKREVNGVTAIYLPTWFHYHAVSWNPALGRYLRARLQNFDVVHIFGLYDLLGVRVAAECRKQNIPYVVEPIGMFVPIVRNVWLKRQYHRAYGMKLFVGASGVIATSEQEQSELQAGGILSARITLRRNGVKAPLKLPPRGKFREFLQLPHNARLVLFLGRLSQKKSPDLLLSAFSDVLRKQKSLQALLHLAMVGPDESGMSTRLRVSAAELGLQDQVHLVGPLSGEAKWSAYRDADIFVLPSQNENFGNTAAEAVAAGTPVVLTDQCGIAPMLADISGLVVKHDRDELAAALENLLLGDSLYRKLKEGCAISTASLSWEQPLQQMEALYRTLAAPSKS
jgi:glycosyltransferase involved in cell wall biosynthesis